MPSALPLTLRSAAFPRSASASSASKTARNSIFWLVTRFTAMKTSSPSEIKPSKSGIGEALLALNRKPVVTSKNSPSPNRVPSAPRTSDHAIAIDTSDLPIRTDHVNLPSPQSRSITDESIRQSLELLFRRLPSLVTAPDRSHAVKTRTPDAFDGSDPRKLDNFIFQCSMYFAARSAHFPDDESQVTFALSYLTDTPLDWFRSELDHATSLGTLPPWFTSYSIFTAELLRLFGPSDPATDAMTSLEGLCYDEASKATRYTLEFNHYARRTGWNESALARRYYQGLPDRLKDELARLGKPTNLRALQDFVCVLDQRYWERLSELRSDPVDFSAPPSPVSPPLSPTSAPPSPGASIRSGELNSSPAPSLTRSAEDLSDADLSDAESFASCVSNVASDLSDDFGAFRSASAEREPSV